MPIIFDIDADTDQIAELERRWKAVQDGAPTAKHDAVVRWLEAWGSSADKIRRAVLDSPMNKKARIEGDEATATLLEAHAEDARRLARYRSTGEGAPWVEVKTWMQSWGSDPEQPAPKPRKL